MFTTPVSVLLCTGWLWELNQTHYCSHTANRQTSHMVYGHWTEQSPRPGTYP